MFEVNARVSIAMSQRYAVRLAKHFEHRASVHREDTLVGIDLRDATCELRPLEEQPDIRVLSTSLQVLTRCREVAARRLRQVAHGEEVNMEWRGSGAAAAAELESVAEGHGR
jgi:hypothetical protein